MPIGSGKIGVMGAGRTPVPAGSETFNNPGTFVADDITVVSVTGYGAPGNPGNPGNAGNPAPGTGYIATNHPTQAYNPSVNTIPNTYNPVSFGSPFQGRGLGGGGGASGLTSVYTGPIPSWFSCGGGHQGGDGGHLPGYPGFRAKGTPYGGGSVHPDNTGGRPAPSAAPGFPRGQGNPGNPGNSGNTGSSATVFGLSFSGGTGGYDGNGGQAGRGGQGGGRGNNGGGSYVYFNPYDGSLYSATNAPGGNGGADGGGPAQGYNWTNQDPAYAYGGGGAGTVNSGSPGDQGGGAGTSYGGGSGFYGGHATGGPSTSGSWIAGGGGSAMSALSLGGYDVGTGAGGGGGRGRPGNPANPGNSGNPGQAASPTTCPNVPITPGGSYPVSVPPGGQIVISWNEQ